MQRTHLGMILAVLAAFPSLGALLVWGTMSGGELDHAAFLVEGSESRPTAIALYHVEPGDTIRIVTGLDALPMVTSAVESASLQAALDGKPAKTYRTQVGSDGALEIQRADDADPDEGIAVVWRAKAAFTSAERDQFSNMVAGIEGHAPNVSGGRCCLYAGIAGAPLWAGIAMGLGALSGLLMVGGVLLWRPWDSRPPAGDALDLVQATVRHAREVRTIAGASLLVLLVLAGAGVALFLMLFGREATQFPLTTTLLAAGGVLGILLVPTYLSARLLRQTRRELIRLATLQSRAPW